MLSTRLSSFQSAPGSAAAGALTDYLPIHSNLRHPWNSKVCLDPIEHIVRAVYAKLQNKLLSLWTHDCIYLQQHHVILERVDTGDFFMGFRDYYCAVEDV